MNIEIQTIDPNSGYEVCIFPRESRRKRSAWIMWIAADGSADLYTERDESGAITGEPIRLGANISRKEILERSDEEDDD